MKRIAFFILSLLLLFVSSAWYLSQKNGTPYLPTFIDPIEGTITIGKDEVPLAGVKSDTKTKTKTKRKKSTKKVKMKSAATKTYSKKLPTKVNTSVKTSTKNTAKANVTIKVTTETTTAQTEKYTKNSKVKLVVSNITIKETTITTTTTIDSQSKKSNVSAAAAVVKKDNLSIRTLAPKIDARVLNAFESLGFAINVDSSVSYDGQFNASSHNITLRDETDQCIYHELGHFIAFLANNIDRTRDFQTIFIAEKDSYNKYNKAYVTQNASEYFAESVKEYVLENTNLKAQRPQTYSAIVSALDKITDIQIATYKKMYGALWA